jgi:hypothetical protein
MRNQMTDDSAKLTKAIGAGGQSREQRHAELMAKLAKNPSFRIVPPSGKTFIIPMPGGMPKLVEPKP